MATETRDSAPRTEREKLVEAALKARRERALMGEAAWCSVGSDMRCSDLSRDPNDWCDTCLALAAADLLQSEGERERPPGHYVCWCGKVVHQSASGTLYEANGDLHECDFLAADDVLEGERETLVGYVWRPELERWREATADQHSGEPLKVDPPAPEPIDSEWWIPLRATLSNTGSRE